jgi:hypothetical protein
MLALEAALRNVRQRLTHHLALLKDLRRTGRRAGRKRKVKDAECGEQRKGVEEAGHTPLSRERAAGFSY